MSKSQLKALVKGMSKEDKKEYRKLMKKELKKAMLLKKDYRPSCWLKSSFSTICLECRWVKECFPKEKIDEDIKKEMDKIDEFIGGV